MTTDWMTVKQLAQLKRVSEQTIYNRLAKGIVVDGQRIEKRARTEADKGFHASTKTLVRAADINDSPPQQEKPQRKGLAQRRKEALEASEQESDLNWQKTKRQEAEDALEDMKRELARLEQQAADADAAKLEALEQRNEAREELDQIKAKGERPAVRQLVSAVWDAVGENEVDIMRDLLLDALRNYVEAPE